jgi:menaquinone-dependent protoporphyrinogen oxidase
MDRVLVAYGTKYGSTAEIAEAIGRTLREHGFDVDVRRAREVRSVAGYRAVVVGSAVYMKRWRGDAQRLLQRNVDALSTRDVWLFNSGPVGDTAGDRSDEALKWIRPEKIRQLGERIGAHDDVVFGGSVDGDRGGFMRRNMAKNTPEATRDVRDWDEIAAWAAGIAATLHGSTAGSQSPDAA